jgi:hypothetical protein
MKRARASIIRKLGSSIETDPERFRIAFDSTENPRRISGLAHCGNWASSNGSIFFGLNIMVLALVDTKTGSAYPLMWARCQKKGSNQNHKRGWQLVIDMLSQLRVEGFTNVTVVGDSWFDGNAFLEALVSMKVRFVIEAKSTRRYHINESSNSIRLRADKMLEDAKKEATQVGTREKQIEPGLKNARYVSRVYGFIQLDVKTKKAMKLQIVGAFNHPREKSPFSIYISNELLKPSTWHWGSARARWNIEVLFRDLKQLLSWGQPPFETSEGALMTLTLPLLIVNALRLSDNEKLGIEFLSSSSLGAKLSYLIDENFCDTIDKIIGNGNIDSSIKTILNRRDKKSSGHKPANKPAEQRKFYKEAAG